MFVCFVYKLLCLLFLKYGVLQKGSPDLSVLYLIKSSRFISSFILVMVNFISVTLEFKKKKKKNEHDQIMDTSGCR